jgi:alpha-glucosidase
VHDIVAEMRAVVDEYDDRVLIGEIYLPVDRLVTYYGREGRGAHLPFNFHLILAPWDARSIEAVINSYEGALPSDAWPNWVLGNHDLPRVPSRIGDEQARVAAVLLLTLRGTPTLYYGEELGLRDVPIPEALVQDVRGTNQPGRGLSRDPVRTPMPWERIPGGGFTTGTPWLPLGEWNLARSVASQRGDSGSMLSLYRRLIELRRAERALSVGSYRPVPALGSALAYRRRHGDRELLVCLNLGSSPGSVRLPEGFECGRVVLSAADVPAGTEYRDHLELEGNEALVLEPL